MATRLPKQLTRYARNLQCLARQLQGQAQGFKTDWHFATGLGNPHPVENGFLWHPTLGVPYLPGAAVKGLLRAWVARWDDSLADDEEEKRKRCLAWFGTEEKGYVPEQAGGLIFFDALPIEPVTLALDVMTPHYGKWYEQGGEIKKPDQEPEKVPADWHDPIPVPFLVVKQAGFLFALAPRRPEFKDQVKPALEALANALDWLGAGAKTAVGYGRMQASEEVKNLLEGFEEENRKQAENSAWQASLSGLSKRAQHWERQIRDQKLESDKNAFNQSIDEWLQDLETNPKADAIDRLTQLIQKHYHGLLENPGKTKGKKQEFVYSEKQRQIALRMKKLKETP